MRKKKKTKEKLPELLRRLETEKELSVTKIRSDRGTEFVNKVIEEYCSKKEITHQLSVARAPQQNGVAERRNRTLKEAAKSMLADSGMNERYWAEVVSTACYTQNRCMINQQLNRTPYEI